MIYCIILIRCRTSGEKNHIWARAQEFTDKLATRDRKGYPVGGAAVPNTGPHWNYQVSR